jgi:hypothetical protein
MAITGHQWAPLAQNEIAKFAMIGSHGELVVNAVVIDDDGKDLEIQRRRRVNPSLAIQVKSSRTRHRSGHRRAYNLWIKFRVKPERVRSDSAYWYAVVYFDRRLPGVREIFLIPSTVFHRRASRSVYQGKVVFSFLASLSPTSRDQWSEFKVPYDQVGRRILSILRELERR